MHQQIKKLRNKILKKQYNLEISMKIKWTILKLVRETQNQKVIRKANTFGRNI